VTKWQKVRGSKPRKTAAFIEPGMRFDCSFESATAKRRGRLGLSAIMNASRFAASSIALRSADQDHHETRDVPTFQFDFQSDGPRT